MQEGLGERAESDVLFNFENEENKYLENTIDSHPLLAIIIL